MKNNSLEQGVWVPGVGGGGYKKANIGFAL